MTVGYGTILPLPPPSATPLEGLELLTFLQGWIVGLCGLPGKMVRPRWQPEPPNIPDRGEAWAAMGITSRPGDTFPYVDESADGLSARLRTNEELHMLCSFYDTGSTGLADKYATLTKHGAAIPQNSEYLSAQGFAVGYTGDLTTVPSLLATQWLYRVDLPVVVRRQIDRVYSVPSILAARGTIHTDDGLSFPIVVDPPAP